MSNITTSDWHAWVNLMPPLNSPGGRLHIIGTVDANSKDFAFLEKREPQGINTTILILDLYLETDIVPVNNPQPVSYNEKLIKMGQYEMIEIYYKNNLEAKIEKIEEVH